MFWKQTLSLLFVLETSLATNTMSFYCPSPTHGLLMYVHEKRLLYTFNNYSHPRKFYRYNMQEDLRTILVYRFEKIDLLFEIKHAYFF